METAPDPQPDFSPLANLPAAGALADPRRRPDEPTPHATDKYHALFNSMDQGFCVLEVLFDETGQQAVDYRYLELNPVFAQQSGMPADAQGKTIRELLPDLESFWFDAFGRVVRTGTAVRLEQQVPQLSRWFDLHAFPLGPPEARQVAVLFTDITVRKQAAEVLRHAAEAETFRLHLADALASLAEPVAMQAAVTRLACRHFGADRCYYCEIENGQALIRHDAAADGLPSVAGTYSLTDFALLQAVIAAGRPFRVRDVRQDEAVDEGLRALCRQLGAVAYLNVPVVRHGQAAGVLCLVQNTPRAWTDAEAALAAEVAERAWVAVERARVERALAASEAKYRTLFDSIDEGFTTIEVVFDDAGKAVDYYYLELNRAHEKITGLPGTVVGRRVSELLPNTGETLLERVGNVALTGEPIRYEEYVPALGRWFDVYTSRVGGSGSRTVANVINDITERKRREAHQHLLLEIGDDLAYLVAPDEIMQAVGARLGNYLKLGVCVFVDVDEERGEVTVHHGWSQVGVPSLKQTFRLAEYLTDEFARELRTGQTFVVRDTATDPRVDGAAYARVNIGAWAIVPFHREGRWVAYLTITDTAPREWRGDEIELVQTVADRIFPRIERARAEEALHESELRRHLAIEAAGLGTYVWHVQQDRTEADPRMLELFGLQENSHLTAAYGLDRVLHPDDRAHYAEAVREATAPAGNGQLSLEFRVIHPGGAVRWLATTGHVAFEGQPRQAVRIVGTVADITERKRHEANLALLAEVSQALTQLADIDATMQALCARVGTYFGAAVCAFSPVDEAAGTVAVQYVWHRPDATSPVGVYRLDDYHSAAMQHAMRAGQPEVVRNTAAGPPEVAAYLAALHIGAFVNLPFVRDGAWLFTLSITASEPRNWYPDELELMHELTARIWTQLERARAEAALKASEQRLRALIENLPGAAVFVVDRALRYREAQGEALLAAGLTPADLLGRTLAEALPPALFAQHLPYYQQALAGQGFAVEHDAYGHTYISRGMPLFGAAGPAAPAEAVLVVSYDITDRKRMEEALRQSEEQFRLFVTASSDALYRMTADWQQMQQLNGNGFLADTTAPHGSWLAAYIPPADQAAVAIAVQAAIAGRQYFELEHRVFRADGAVGWTFSRAVPVLDGQGELVEWFGTATDITARKQAEEALRHSLQQQALFEAVQAAQEAERRRMAESLHNGIGQLLFATKLRLDRLHAPLPGSDASLVTTRHEADELLGEAIRQTRALSHELVPLVLEEFGLAAALQDIGPKMSTPQLHLHSQAVLDEADGPLAPPLQMALYRMAQELALNISKHAHGATEASLELETMPGWVLLRAEDNGPGFAPNQDQSPGLGLRSIRDRVALLGGQLETGTAPTGGAYVRIRIPLPSPPAL